MDDTLASVLPAKARKKFAKLERDQKLASAAVSGLWEELHRVRKERDWKEATKRSHVAPFIFHREGDEELASLDEEVAELEAQIGEADRRSAMIAPVISAVEGWLKHMRDVGAKLVDVAPPQVKPTADLERAIEKVRVEIAELDEQYQQVENAPAPAADLKRRAIADIDRLAKRGQPNLYAMNRTSSPVSVDDRLRMNLFEPASFLAWVMRDLLVDRIGDLVDALPTTGVLTDDEREQRLRSIAERKLAAERIEEVLVERTRGADPRRPDCDPRAILSVADV
jgi:hypothetical protein